MKPLGTGHWQSYPLNGSTSSIVTELPRCFARSFTVEGILIPCGHQLTGKFAFGQARHECAGGASSESATRLDSFSVFRRIDKMSTDAVQTGMLRKLDVLIVATTTWIQHLIIVTSSSKADLAMFATAEMIGSMRQHMT